jgi:LuxR family transcriptional regulator, maltose regulon positive regulatory protein
MQIAKMTNHGMGDCLSKRSRKGDEYGPERVAAPRWVVPPVCPAAHSAGGCVAEIPDARLIVPILPPRCIPRPRLVSVLNTATQRPLTLVAAGPGSGKTVLLSQWARSRPTPPAWVSLGASDNDPARFWPLVTAAFRVAGVEPLDSELDSSLTASIDDDMAVIDPYLLSAAAGSQPLQLVLDDAHVLTHPAILDGLDSLLRGGWTRLRLVLSARTDPLLPLHRYRLAGHMSELRAQQLAMTGQEAHALLGEHGVSLSSREFDVLTTRTEGWAAGLRLSAMSMEGVDRPGDFLTEFALDQGSIGEYLMNEVLDRQPEDVRRLLIDTSFLEEIDADLAEAVTGRSDAGEMLAELSRTNAFVVPLDRACNRFRYHQLFGEILRYLLRRETPQRRDELLDRAAHWYYEHGRFVEALRLAVDRKDWERAAAMVVRGGFAHAFISRRWVGGVTPADLTGHSNDQNGDVTLARAALHAAAGDTTEAEHELASFRREFDPDSDHDVTLTRTLTELLVARAQHRTRDLEVIASGVTEDPDIGPAQLAAVYLEQGSAHFWAGHYDAAEESFVIALERANDASDPQLELRCICQLALFHAYWGRIRACQSDEDHAFALSRGEPALIVPTSLHLARVVRAIYQADFPTALRSLRQADVAAKEEIDPDVRAAVPVLRGLLLAQLGQAGPAQSVLARSDGALATILADIRTAALTDIEISLGRQNAAAKRLRTAGPSAHAAASAAALARAYLALGELRAAEDAARVILTSSETSATRTVVVEALIIHAQVAAARGDETRAVESLVRACELSSGEIVLPFARVADDFEAVRARHASLRALWPAAPTHGVAGALDDADDQADSAAPVRLPDPLTERERTVLRWLSTTMSTNEIAEEMCLSVNTVKTHIAAIYRKLAAARRRDAVLKARTLELL